jgi:hypothetical protein
MKGTLRALTLQSMRTDKGQRQHLLQLLLPFYFSFLMVAAFIKDPCVRRSLLGLMFRLTGRKKLRSEAAQIFAVRVQRLGNGLIYPFHLLCA